jgi:hypothetical protein
VGKTMEARPNTIAGVPAHHAGILHPRLNGGEQAAALPTGHVFADCP